MQALTNLYIVLLFLTNMRLLGSGWIYGCIETVALQAALLGGLPVLLNWSTMDLRLGLLTVANLISKAIILPWMLRRGVRKISARREIVPFVDFNLSLIIGLGLLGLCFMISIFLRSHVKFASPLLIPMALFTIATGLFLIVARKTAIVQVLGYLAMENGIYAFGMTFAMSEPLLVEMGVMLDIFVAVFVMGITINQISLEFDHISTDRLSVLKD